MTCEGYDNKKLRLAPDLSAYALRERETNTVYLYCVLRSFNADQGLGPGDPASYHSIQPSRL